MCCFSVRLNWAACSRLESIGTTELCFICALCMCMMSLMLEINASFMPFTAIVLFREIEYRFSHWNYNFTKNDRVSVSEGKLVHHHPEYPCVMRERCATIIIVITIIVTRRTRQQRRWRRWSVVWDAKRKRDYNVCTEQFERRVSLIR